MHDGLGSVRQPARANGQIATTYAYDPFGVSLSAGTVRPTPIASPGRPGMRRWGCCICGPGTTDRPRAGSSPEIRGRGMSGSPAP
jgi:hypothetical protein